MFCQENGFEEIKFDKQKMLDFGECLDIFKKPFILEPFENTKIIWNKFYINDIKCFLDKIQVDETEEDTGQFTCSRNNLFNLIA